MDEVFARAEDRHERLRELGEIGYELLVNCRLRKQIGPAQLNGLPPAPTVIATTLWIPWVGGSPTWMLADLFGSGQGGNYTPQGTGGG